MRLLVPTPLAALLWVIARIISNAIDGAQCLMRAGMSAPNGLLAFAKIPFAIIYLGKRRGYNAPAERTHF
mgnify:FL=1